MNGWLVASIRWMCLALVRLFYRAIAVRGLAHLPPGGAAILVANHPNGLLDPVILQLAVGKRVGFLAKSTLFGNPIGRLALQAFAALPVFRSRDGQDPSQNDKTFALARQRLAESQWLGLFPEGASHSDPAMRPLKTGAARIALSFAAEHPDLPLSLVPTGLLYQAKQTFRSGVAVQLGAAIDVQAFARQHGTDFAAAQGLTDLVHGQLADVVLQADSDHLWRGFVAVTAWTHAAAARDVAAQQAVVLQMAAAWRALVQRDPAQATQLIDLATRFAAELSDLGIDDPWQIDVPLPTRLRVMQAAASLVLQLPLAVLGAILGWPMYRAIRPLAVRLAGTETDLIGTLKLLLGLVLLPTWWAAQALLAGAYGVILSGWAVALLGPLAGYVALRWAERWQRRSQVVRLAWMRATAAQRMTLLRARRDELVMAVTAVLAPTAAPALADPAALSLADR